jgi:hypothetical protein
MGRMKALAGPLAMLALATCASGAAGVLATPQLLVTGATETGASAATLVEVKEETTDAAPSRISIYVPAGYVANLGQTAGTQIGTVTTSMQALASSPEAIEVAGTILTDTPAKHVDDACAPGVHAAVWLLHLDVRGTSFDLPVYVDRATGADAAFSSAKLVLCSANPYEQALPGTRAPLGVKLVDVQLMLSAGALTNPTVAGSYVWRTVVTPWTANGATENTAAASEAQSIVTVPSSLSLKAQVRTTWHMTNGRRTATNSVLLSGKVAENLKGIPGVKVMFYANGKTAGSAPTGASGAFSTRTGLTRKTTIRATATVPARATACVNALPATLAPAGCVGATIAGYRLGSDTVTATPRTR